MEDFAVEGEHIFILCGVEMENGAVLRGHGRNFICQTALADEATRKVFLFCTTGNINKQAC